MNKVNNLVNSKWDKLALYTMSKEEITALLQHPKITVEEGWMPAGYKFPKHYHRQAQILLVISGKLTHISGTISYTQSPNDLLIVPANLKHTAIVGNEELRFCLILRKE